MLANFYNAPPLLYFKVYFLHHAPDGPTETPSAVVPVDICRTVEVQDVGVRTAARAGWPVVAEAWAGTVVEAAIVEVPTPREG